MQERRKKKWTVWRANNDEAKTEFQKAVTGRKEGRESRRTLGDDSKIAKKRCKVAHSTKNDRDEALQETPENVRIREEVAARCTKVSKRRVLKKQARKARADQQRSQLTWCCRPVARHVLDGWTSVRDPSLQLAREVLTVLQSLASGRILKDLLLIAYRPAVNVNVPAERGSNWLHHVLPGYSHTTGVSRSSQQGAKEHICSFWSGWASFA